MDKKQTEQHILKTYPEHLFAIGFSGGKDSTATLIYLTKVLQLKNVIPVFADTGHEHELTYSYLDYIGETLLPVTRIQGTCGQLFKKSNPAVKDPEEPLTMESLCRIKKRFPGAISRFCTTELKLKVQKKWISQQSIPVVNVSGVRREESLRRKDTPFFIEEDPFMETPLWNPITDLTAAEVFDLHKQFGVEPNPLYKRGMSRVGCFPCIMARKSELNTMATEFPEYFHKLSDMEKRVSGTSERGSSFFPADKTAKRFRRQLDKRSGTRYANALDVMDWALSGEPEGDVFETDDIASPVCSSIYGLCE